MDVFERYRKEHPEAFRKAEESAYPPGTPRVVRWVIQYSGGLIKDERQAGYVLIGFTAVAIIISLILLLGRGETSEIRPESFQNKPQFLP